jgi:RNA polymerase sigma-70 factor (ECF subfamily)
MMDYNQINRLLSEVRKNRDHLLEYLFHRYYHQFFCLAIQFIHDPQQAKDVMQEIFIELFNRLHELNTAESVEVFLHTATRDACLQYRQQLRNTTRNNAALTGLTAIDEHTAENALIQAEVLLTIEQEIEKLPKERKKVVKQWYEGFSYKEIAAKLHLSEQTVRNQKSLAMFTLRKALWKKIF